MSEPIATIPAPLAHMTTTAKRALRVVTESLPSYPGSMSGVLSLAMQVLDDHRLLVQPKPATKDEDHQDRERDAEQYAPAPTVEWYKARYDALLALCAGRPATHLMTVQEILHATDAPEEMTTGAPLQITWTGTVTSPAHGGPAVVPGTTTLGGPAALVLPPHDAHQLGQMLRPARAVPDEDEARCVGCGCTEDRACPGGCTWVPNAGMVDLCSACVCTTEGCGLPAGGEEMDESDPMLWGWIYVKAAGTERAGRWVCSPPCAAREIAAAGQELAEIDRAAEHAPDQTRTEAAAGGEDQ